MSWRGNLALRYSLRNGRTVAQDRHEGPLRVLQALYPEGDAICHHVLVHPPGGLVGGDELEMQVDVGPGAHALITTPGATRYYRSDGPLASQDVRLCVAAGGRLEWLPLENIAYVGCRASASTRLQLAEGAQAMGWDLLALGLPAAGADFTAGRFAQRLEVEGAWLEAGRVDASDRLLLDSALGWAGHSVLATAWFASGGALAQDLRQSLLDAGREALQSAWASRSACPGASPETHPSPPQDLPAWGVTAVRDGVVVARALAHRVEPAMAALLALRAAWRQAAWGLPPNPARIWRT